MSPERETGTIEIIKTTTGPEGSSVDLGGRFSFLVSCSGGFRQTVTVDVPSATGSSTGSTSLGAMDEGVECYVSEQAPGPDWTIVESSEGPLTVRSGEITEASFTNERRTGSIEIIKTLLGVPESADLSAEQFTAEVICFGDFVGTSMVESDVAFSVDAPALIDGLPIGAICRVTEDPDRRFTSTYSPTTSGSAAEVTIAAPTAYPVVIANATGSIIISKQTVVTDSSIDPTGDFRFEVDCGAAYTGTVVVSADEPTPNGAQGSLSYDELPLLPDGTQCTVTELAAPAGWTLDTPNGVNVVVSSFMAPTATFTNSRDVGSVVITKSVSGLPDDLDLGDETFDVDITCTGGFVGSELTIVGEQVSPVEPLTVEDIPIGSICEVSEQDDLRFETRYQPSATSGDAARVYVDGAGVAVEITNIAGRLEIEKTTSAISDLDLDVGGEFDFSVSCDNGFSTSVAIEVPTANERSTARVEYPTLPIMRPGTLCWVTEQFPGPEWLQTGAAATPVVIPDGSVVVASFTNQRRTGELRVTKRLGGVPAGDDANDDAFIVDVNCTGDLVDGSVSFDDRSVSVAEPLSITGIPVGSVCRVVEASDDRFAVTYSPADAAGTAGEIEIGPGVATISLANTTGRLSITKRTLSPVGIPVDISGDFSFAISCNNGYRDEVAVSVPDGGSSASATVAHPEIALLRPGTECFVAELFPGSEWEIGETVEFPVTIPESGVVDVVFENTRKTADLTIDLRFVGLPAGAELSDEVFDLNVECTGDFDVSPITFSGIEVSGTEVATLENLPVGSTCVVDGLDDERFDTTWSPAGGGGASILIGPDGARVQVTNTVGSIQITKTVVGSPDWPVDLSGRFTFDVTCDNGYVGVHSVDIDGSEGGANASERLVHPELPLVAPGTQCSVEERDPGVKWIRAVEGPMVRTVPSGGVVNFSLTNSRASGNIRVLKVIEGAPESDLSEEFFDVDLSCEGDFVDGSFTSAEPLAVASGTPLLLNRLPTGARCEIEERHDDLRFEAPAYSASGDGGPGAIVFVVDETKELTITNTATPLADLVVTKTVTGAIGTQFDAEGFGLDVVCTGDFLGGTFRPEGSQSVSVNRPLTIAGIPIGAECKVTEFADSRFTQESVPADGTVTIGADGAELELVNAVLEVAGVEAVNPVNQPAAPTAEPSTPAASAPAGTVAKTGADSRSIAWFGLVLCLSGLLLVAARRRLGHLD